MIAKMGINHRTKKKYILLSLILFRAIIDFSFIKLIIPIFGYTGFELSTTTTKYIASWILFFAFLPLILQNFQKATLSANMIILLTLISLIPTLSLIGLTSYKFEYIFLTIIYWTILFIANLIMPSVKLKFPKVNTTNIFFWGILIVLSSTIIYISGRYTNFRFHFSLVGVYDLRMEQREFGLPILLSYLLAAATNIIPMYLVYFLNTKNIKLVLFLSVIILLNFGIGGHKTVFFMFFLCFIGYWFYKFKYSNLFVWLFIFICLIGLVQYYFFNSYIIGTISTYRLLYVPSQLNYYYYDFFSTQEYDFFRQSFLRWFGFTSPYKDNIAFMIGEKYLGSDSIRANNGLFSDAYMNMGVLGVCIFPLILIFLIRLIDASAVGLSERLVFLPVIVTVTAFLSTTFFTALLTNGLLIMMLTLYFLPRKKKME